MSIRFVLVVAATVLSVAACGSEPSPPATATTTPSSAGPAKLSGLQEYQSAQAIADDLARFGHTCVLTLGSNGFAIDSGKCASDVGPLQLSVYGSQEKMHDQLSFVSGYLGRVGKQYGWLSGTSWAIDCGSRAVCERLQADLGGSITANR